MKTIGKRLTRRVASGLCVAVAAITLSSPAFAADSMTPSPGASGLGSTVGYVSSMLQDHLDAPLLGLTPLLTQPVPYLTGHVLPFVLNVVGLATGSSDLMSTGSY